MDNTRTRRILLIAGEYPPYMFGGGATFMYHLSRGLSKKGLDVTVVALKLAQRLTTETHIENVDSKLRVIRISIPSFAYPHHEFFQLRARRIVSKLIRTHDIIHMNTGLYYPWLRRIIKYSNRPVIVTIHGDPILDAIVSIKCSTLAKVEMKLYNSLYMLESYLSLKKEINDLYPVFVSKSVYETLSRKFNIKHYSIIYNGIDFDFIDNALRIPPRTILYNLLRSARERGYKVMLYASRFYPRKNHIALLPLMHSVLKMGNSKVLLVLTSDGPLWRFIQKKIAKLNLLSRIILTGRLAYDEVLRITSLADVVVFPSLYEAHPISIVEALYLRKPVVAFNLPYVKELNESCKGLNIRFANSFSEFVEKTFELLTSEKPANIDNNNECLFNVFNVERMVESYLNTYNDAQDLN